MPRALRSNTKAPADRVSLPRAAKKNSVDTSKLEKKIKNLQAKLKTSVEKVKQLEIVAYDTCLERERLNESTQMMEQERQKYTEAYKELENEKKKLGETNTEKAEPFCCKICLRAYTTAAALSPRLLSSFRELAFCNPSTFRLRAHALSLLRIRNRVWSGSCGSLPILPPGDASAGWRSYTEEELLDLRELATERIGRFHRAVG